jgi:hypothetical protein
VYGNIARHLAGKLAFGPQEHKVRLKTTAVEMAKKRNKDTLCTASREGADQKDYLFSRVRTFHSVLNLSFPAEHPKAKVTLV